jgi:hypothetical protein
MKLKISFIIFVLCWVLALADHSAKYKSIQFYAEELLETRHDLDGHGFTPIETLRDRLAVLAAARREQAAATPRSAARGDRWLDTGRQEKSAPDRRWRTVASVDIPDMMVNQEDYTSSFNQRNPSICMFPDRSFVTVWQDERNGDLDVFAQGYSFSGSPQGFNFEASEEDYPKDQYLPCVSLIDDTSFVVVWVDEEDFDIRGKPYHKDLSPAGSAFQIDDSPIPFTTWSPAISSSQDGKSVVVWADTRSGSNVYGRRFDSSGNPLGAGFKVNQDDGGMLHASPRVAVGLSGNFVVAWEDYRNLDGDIYVQRFDSSGAKVGDNLLVNLDSLDEDQYTPSVSMGLNDRFMVAWIDLRHEDEAVFARSFSFDDPLGDTVLFSISSDTSLVVQDAPPVAADTLGRFTLAWTEYTQSNAIIYALRFDSSGQTLSDTIIISDAQSIGERHGPAMSSRPDGSFAIAWMDRRSGNYDVCAQAVTSDGFLNGVNLTLNDDELGANQDHPQIAIRADGGFAVVWEDFRSGGSDIFVRRFDLSANPLSDDRMVNDSLGRFYHGKPDLACDESGNLLVVWEDTRESLLEIYAQLFDDSGNPTGGNFRVNCQGMINNFAPGCDMSPAGDFVVVWSASEGAQNDVYGRLFSSSGEPVDTCFRINDDGLVVDHLQARVAMDSSGGFVVVWQDRREEHERVYAQRYAPGGSEVGANLAIPSDRPDPVQYEADLDVNGRGDFVVTWVEPLSSSTMVYAQRFDSSGASIDTNLTAVDDPSASPESPKAALTDDGYLVVAWTDRRALASDIYFQTFLNGLRQGSNQRVNEENGALQELVDMTARSPFLYSVWRDNRVPGLGFSIFFNTVNFTETAVEDDQDQESLPADFHLSQNYPNPFNPVTRIQYTVGGKHRQSAVSITLRIYNVLGQLVRTLVDEERLAGSYQVTWDGKDDQGRELSSGLYLYKLESEDLRVTSRRLFLK